MDPVKLGIDEITPGMRLAEPVSNAAGVTLMPSGIRLTPMFIVRLKKWNVSSLLVFPEKQDADLHAGAKQPAGADGGKKSPLEAAAGTSEVNEFTRSIVVEAAAWFANVEDDPLMMQLRATAVKKLVAHGEQGILNIMRRNSREAEAGGGG